MQNPSRPYQELIDENAILKQRLEDLEAKCKRAEEALKESEENYLRLLDKAPAAIYRVDFKTGKFLQANEIFYEYLGCTQEELTSVSPYDIMTEDSQKLFLERLEKMAKGMDVSETAEYEIIGKNGKRWHLQLHNKFIYDAEGHLVASDVIATDIPDRKLAEEALRKSEAYFRAITENSSDFLFIADAGGIITYASPSIERIAGYRPEELIGTNGFNLVIPEDRPRVIEDVERAIQTKDSNVPKSFRVKHKNGAILDMEWVGANLLDDPVISGFVITARDVTVRKQAEERSSLAEEKFSKIFMMTPDGISITRMEDGLIIDTNIGFEEILGWERNKVLGQTSLEVNFWNDPADRAFMVNELKAGRDVLQREFQFRRKDGALRNGIYSARTIQIAGEARIVFIMQDITDRRNLEQQLSQVQKMEAIGTLAGGIAHDFNNILSGIMGYAELCQNVVQDRPKAHDYMAHLLKAADRAKELIKHILTFSRQAEHDKRPIILAPMVKEIVTFMRASLPTTIEIMPTIDETTNAIMADPSQIHQVLMNLCTNAGHAMKETGGVLEIGLKEIVVDAGNIFHHPLLKPGRYLELSVRDNGYGISQQNLKKIFDPYFTTKRIGEGTGLGLAVVHGIVKDHGGDIHVSSDIGKGTTFRVYLPLLGKIAKDSTNVREAILPGKGETILFVDDEKMVVDLSREMLESLHYKVVTETDPLCALETFRGNCDRFDIVITDKTMPHITGFDVAREIRDIRPDIPILLCSGLQEDTDLEKLEVLGISQLIAKPVRRNELANAIRDALDKK